MFRVSKLADRVGNNISYGHIINRFLKNTNRPMTYSRYPDIEDKLKMLETHRLSDSNKELERLKKDSIIHNRLAKVNAHYKASSSYSHELPILHQIAYGRSLEVFEKIKKTHYVFHHGQPGGFLVLNTLTKLLLEPIKPGEFLKSETILRHPSSLKEIKPEMHNVEWYKKMISWEKIRHTTFMHEATDHKYTNSLVSVDGYLASTDQSESALSSFYNNAWRGAGIRAQVVAEIAKYYFCDINIQRSFIEEYNKLTDEVASSIGGNLYTICVPKNFFNECGYLSEPFGVAATINKEDVSDVLEKMQEEITPNKYDSLKMNKTFYQVRLLAHKLDPEKVKIFIFPSASDEQLDNIAKETSNLIKLFRNYLQIKQRGSSCTAIGEEVEQQRCAPNCSYW